MTTCELCGKESYLKRVRVEGTTMNVCPDCAGFGTVLEQPSLVRQPKRKTARRIPELEEPTEGMVSNYGERVRKAREKRSLTQKRLAELIAEKESVIHKVESGHLEPDIKLAKKLEQFLKVKLMEEIKQDRRLPKRLEFNDKNLTIGDLIRIKNDANNKK